MFCRRTHQNIFGCVVIEEQGEWFGGGEAMSLYQQNVLSRVPQRVVEASLSWLVPMGAITVDQSSALDRVYEHLHDLTHELLKYVVDAL